MLKILQIIPNLSKGGAERLVLNICHELAKREQITVQLVTFHTQNEYVELTEGLDWIVIPSTFVPSISGKAKKETGALQQFIESFQPDVIHTHLWEAEMVSRQINYPHAKWFTHFHDNMTQLSKTLAFSKKGFTNLYERWMLLKKYKACNNQYICISKDTLHFAHHVLPSFFYNNIHLLNNAIDVERFQRQTTEFAEELKLVTIGSLVNKKNLQFLIHVVNILIEKVPLVHLDILGDGPNFNQLKNQIELYRLQRFITLHGNINRVEEYLWQSAIYVHSATYEPFGLVLLEAMAAGLPVVCLDGKGNRDIIEEGKNGFMVFKPNAERFAEKVLELWNDKELYAEMSNFAVEYTKQYDIKEYVSKLIGIYGKH